jgi:hypothetical protein
LRREKRKDKRVIVFLDNHKKYMKKAIKLIVETKYKNVRKKEKKASLLQQKQRD